jgi:hypothetical protein
MVSSPAELCVEPHRRRDIRERGSNGIDYIEVSDDRLTLTVYLLNRFATTIVPANVRIAGGTRVRDINVTGIRLRGPDESDGDTALDIAIDRPGDSSTYVLSLIELDNDGQPTDQPLTGIDPRYARADFSFRLGETTDDDCRQSQGSPVHVDAMPEINYLARDYASFRQMILDRLAVTLPDWREQHVPDTGIALIEILAYVADHLSYYQDAVATEAYLGTARQRISVRRHARLVDYAMHDGCNARALIFVATDVQEVTIEDPTSLHFFAGYSGSAPLRAEHLVHISPEQRDQLVVFEPMTDGAITLRAAHNSISFYTWGDGECRLPAGALSATLRDDWTEVVPDDADAKPQQYAQAHQKRGSRKRSAKSAAEPEAGHSPPKPRAANHIRERKLDLRAGDILLFEEVRGPTTGLREDANPAHRHFVRLTEVREGHDPLFDQPVLEISWEQEDALPFVLRLSSRTVPLDDGDDISVARGNIVVADHGNWTGQGSRILFEELPAPEAGKKFRPALKRGPLTFRHQNNGAPPKQLLQDPRSAVPELRVYSIPPILDGAAPVFTFADLKNPASLAARLAGAKDVPSLNFLDRLSTPPRGSARTSAAGAVGTDAASVEAMKDKIESLMRVWTPQSDLLSSRSSDFHFVVEMDDQGVAHLRFGDGQNGRAPELSERFAASYRVGIGAGGNVGADTITQVLMTSTGNVDGLAPRNPLPAMGGTDPEPIERVKLLAPKSSRGDLVRAVSADDYARLAERHAGVQRAAAQLQWAGTRYEAHVAIDPLGTETVDPALLRRIRTYLHRHRRIGHDVIVVPPTYVPLDIAMTAYVLAGYAQGPVETVLRGILSDRRLPDGQLGFFHPDQLSFGESIYASRLIASAQRVDGVERVVVTRLHRRFELPDQELERGYLPIGPLEIARVGSNRASREDGRFVLTVRGGS